ncbi:MAG: sigma-70 family RNA polymerase sigma factor [Candidatus Saccharicenans sp.]|jgi:RNA polymerase sigma-70 factor (ECF subfamily)|nr:sigma-70 family RNA polymerase sigma factor [Candidatus Saccharicenans sp.]MDH7575495.1 sigma-70 family RNA polymerase sigma factor [Candidatus Saccharicenans sp.]
MIDREQELDLVNRARRGEVEAFMTLIKTYQVPIYRLVYRMTGNREDAADLMQETMLKAYTGLKNFKARSGFNTWLYRIAVNETLNFLQRSGRERGKMEYLDEINTSDSSLAVTASPEETLMGEEFRTRLEQALAELPADYKLAFTLVVFQGLSHSEAAEVLGCSEGTVSWKIHEARKILREKMRPYLERVREV